MVRGDREIGSYGRHGFTAKQAQGEKRSLTMAPFEGLRPKPLLPPFVGES